jgi:hypothetical protein
MIHDFELKEGLACVRVEEACPPLLSVASVSQGKLPDASRAKPGTGVPRGTLIEWDTEDCDVCIEMGQIAADREPTG